MKEDYLLDTNILIYSVNTDSKYYTESNEFINRIIANGNKATTTINNLIEFYSVITSHRRVSNPITNKEANSVLDFFNETFRIIYPNLKTLDKLKELIIKTTAKTKHIFDLYIAAISLTNNVNTIVSYNVRDFQEIENLKVISPSNY